MAKVIMLGAGGHARVLLDTLRVLEVPVEGALVRAGDVEAARLHIPILGDDDYLNGVSPDGIELVNGIGGVKDTELRRAVYERHRARGFRFRTVIHPRAYIAYIGSGVVLADGVQIMAGAVVQPDTIIRSNSIVNTRASIDHDCHIGSHVHIAPGVVLSGSVQVGDSTHVGTGAIAIQGMNIGSRCLIAAGAVVVSDVPDGAIAKGVPARIGPRRCPTCGETREHCFVSPREERRWLVSGPSVTIDDCLEQARRHSESAQAHKAHPS